MSKDLFGRLEARAPEFASSDASRWIKRLSDEDSELLAKADIDTVRLGRHLGGCHITHRDMQVVSIVGLSDHEYNIEGLYEIDATPALFQLTILSLELSPTETDAEIRDALEGQDSSVQDYDGHELDQIANLFPPVSYFAVEKSGSTFLSDIRRVLGIAICKSEYDLPLDLRDPVRLSFIEVFEGSSDQYPVTLALQGLVSAFWQTQFVEIYRTIEQLFPAKSLKTLADKIGYRGANSTLRLELADALGWHPREDGALSSLVNDLPGEIIEQYRQVFGIPSDAKDLPAAVAKNIYQTRNAIVHYRGPNELGQISEANWRLIIEATCRFSVHAYSTVSRSYFANSEPPEVEAV